MGNITLSFELWHHLQKDTVYTGFCFTQNKIEVKFHCKQFNYQII